MHWLLHLFDRNAMGLKPNTPHTVQDFRLLKGYPLKEDWIC